MSVKAKKRSLTAFTILFIILAVLCVISVLLNGQPISDSLISGLNPEKYGDLVNMVANGETVTVVGAKFSDFFMAFPRGFVDAADLIVFIMAIGGFIGVVMKTGALEAGVYHLVKKMHGREEVLIVILMILFSIGGSTYGMAEETIGFYALITTALVAAGFDTMVAVATVLLGAGCGVLGSTINPFATGAAMAALQSVNVPYDNTLVMILGFALWFTSLAIAIFFVLGYAKKVKADKGSTILSLQEQEDMREHFTKDDGNKLEFTGKHKAVLIVFAISFAVMIASLISYVDINFAGDEEAYLAVLGWTSVLTGLPLGQWYFSELAAWFTFSSVLIAIMARMSEREFIDTFLDGAKDLLSVAIVIAVARGITVVMKSTHMDFWILDKAAGMLMGVPGFVFAPLSYVIYLVLSFLVPSTSGLAGFSMPVMGGLANTLGFNASIMINIFCAGCGLINLFTPTSGVVMGGLGAAKVELKTYMKWGMKLFVAIAIANIVVLSLAMMLIK